MCCFAVFILRKCQGTIVSIDLDPRELVVDSETNGYRVVHLVFPPVRVIIFIQTAYDAGLHLEGLNRGEIAVGIETRTFTALGLHERTFCFKRTQIPLLPGHLSSVYRAQVCANAFSPQLPIPQQYCMFCVCGEVFDPQR